MAAAQSVAVEVALGQRLLEAGALHLVHVDRPDAWRRDRQNINIGTQEIIFFLLSFHSLKNHSDVELSSSAESRRAVGHVWRWTQECSSLDYSMLFWLAATQLLLITAAALSTLTCELSLFIM